MSMDEDHEQILNDDKATDTELREVIKELQDLVEKLELKSDAITYYSLEALEKVSRGYDSDAAKTVNLTIQQIKNWENIND